MLCIIECDNQTEEKHLLFNQDRALKIIRIFTAYSFNEKKGFKNTYPRDSTSEAQC